MKRLKKAVAKWDAKVDGWNARVDNWVDNNPGKFQERLIAIAIVLVVVLCPLLYLTKLLKRIADLVT